MLYFTRRVSKSGRSHDVWSLFLGKSMPVLENDIIIVIYSISQRVQ